MECRAGGGGEVGPHPAAVSTETPAVCTSSSGLDVHDLRVVVADLVGELGVDVHDLVGELADALADQDVVQDLGDTVEVVGVLLVGRQGGDQVGQRRLAAAA